jgi:hypothetical protein
MSTTRIGQPVPMGPDIAAIIRRDALASLTPAQTGAVRLSLSPHVFPQGHIFNLVDTKLVVKQTAALVFVDLMP